jgi:sporulation protein YlmC with PRC-barrel domain
MQRLFATELVGKTATGKKGEILGIVDDMIFNSADGRIKDVLIVPTEELPMGAYNVDTSGRVVLPFSSLRSVKDVVVLEGAEE